LFKNQLCRKGVNLLYYAKKICFKGGDDNFVTCIYLNSGGTVYRKMELRFK